MQKLLTAKAPWNRIYHKYFFRSCQGWSACLRLGSTRKLFDNSRSIGR